MEGYTPPIGPLMPNLSAAAKIEQPLVRLSSAWPCAVASAARHEREKPCARRRSSAGRPAGRRRPPRRSRAASWRASPHCARAGFSSIDDSPLAFSLIVRGGATLFRLALLFTRLASPVVALADASLCFFPGATVRWHAPTLVAAGFLGSCHVGLSSTLSGTKSPLGGESGRTEQATPSLLAIRTSGGGSARA